MPKLLKFSCHNCGAKLAVPLQMAGLTDHCPKCGSLVCSPDLPPDPPAKSPQPEAPEAWTAADLVDALRPGPSSAPLAVSATPEPPGPEVASSPPVERKVDSKKASAPNPESVTEPDPPAVATKAQPSMLTSILATSQVEARKTTPAIHPRATLQDEPPVRTSTELGELPAESYSETVAEPLPRLTVPFLPVTSSPQKERRQRKHRYIVIGLVIFLLLDVVVGFWLFNKPILEWWRGTTSERTNMPGDTEKNVTDSNPAPSGPSLSNVKPGGTGLPAPAADAPSALPLISAPSDFEAPPPPATKPVPMAIPVQEETAPILAPTPPVVPAEKLKTDALPPPSSPPTPPPLPQSEDMTSKVLGGLPPPPPDMALPNGPPPADVQALLSPTNPEKITPRVSKVTPQAKPALEVLLQFLQAPTYKERGAFVLQSIGVKAAMEKHAAEFGDGPIQVASVEFLERYAEKKGVPPYCMFELQGGSLKHNMLALVEQPLNGQPKVDWETFVEFKEDLLLKFLEAEAPLPQKFRVMMRRKHYFDKDVAKITEKDGFAVKQPGADFEGHVFVPKGTPLAQQLSNQLAWGMDMPVIAELMWKTEGARRWVEIKTLVSYGWRG